MYRPATGGLFICFHRGIKGFSSILQIAQKSLGVGQEMRVDGRSSVAPSGVGLL